MNRGDVPIEAVLDSQRFAEVTASALTDDAEARSFRALVARLHEAPYDLVDRTIAADRDDRFAPVERRFPGELGGVLGALGERDVDRSERTRENGTKVVDGAPRAPSARLRVDDRERRAAHFFFPALIASFIAEKPAL